MEKCNSHIKSIYNSTIYGDYTELGRPIDLQSYGAMEMITSYVTHRNQHDVSMAVTDFESISCMKMK